MGCLSNSLRPESLRSIFKTSLKYQGHFHSVLSALHVCHHPKDRKALFLRKSFLDSPWPLAWISPLPGKVPSVLHMFCWIPSLWCFPLELNSCDYTMCSEPHWRSVCDVLIRWIYKSADVAAYYWILASYKYHPNDLFIKENYYFLILVLGHYLDGGLAAF